MKLIIIEGPDRVGKDTLIQNLLNEYNNVYIRHWCSPLGNSNAEKIAYQKKSFLKEFNTFHVFNKLTDFNDSIMIWNRSHIGEIVYGTMYRKYQPEEWVFDMEEFCNFDKIRNVYLVCLYADPEFLIKRDDGKSFSKELKDKEKEIQLFLHATELSKIRKKKNIKVNKKDEYVDQLKIFEKVKKLIK